MAGTQTKQKCKHHKDAVNFRQFKRLQNLRAFGLGQPSLTEVPQQKRTEKCGNDQSLLGFSDKWCVRKIRNQQNEWICRVSGLWVSGRCEVRTKHVKRNVEVTVGTPDMCQSILSSKVASSLVGLGDVLSNKTFQFVHCACRHTVAQKNRVTATLMRCPICFESFLIERIYTMMIWTISISFGCAVPFLVHELVPRSG